MENRTLATRPQITPLPAFKDNYIWMMHRAGRAVIVDPGDAEVVRHALAHDRLELEAVLVTHHHADHIGGLQTLIAAHSPRVFGPHDARIAGIDHPVAEGARISLLDGALDFTVMEVPGHTDRHIAYAGDGLLFCGDTLFSAGCGRLLGGSAAQLHASLARLAALPDDTEVFCTHEYTLANLDFAAVVEPGNRARASHHEHARRLRERGLPTLPTTIGLEQRINPFLRPRAPEVIEAVTRHDGTPPPDALACFTRLRAWKDVF